MRFTTASLTVLMVVALAVSAGAQYAQYQTIPGNTVIPVIMDNTLSSATSRIGDTFISHCSGVSCGGFPANTQFTGVVTSVTRASRQLPGQIGVSFTSAALPNGRVIPLSGQLISLSPNEVGTDPATGLMTARPGATPDRNKFIAYGAGAGLVIGAISGNTLRGGILGAAAGWLYGAIMGREAMGRDVTVPAGTEFGILLTQPVDFRGQPPVPVPTPAPVPRPGRGPGMCPLSLVYAGDVTPITRRGVTLVPAEATMQAIGVRFSFNTATEIVRITSGRLTLTHEVGTSTAEINGRTIRLSAPSRMVQGVLYVPTDLVSAVTGSRVTWDQATGTLEVD